MLPLRWFQSEIVPAMRSNTVARLRNDIVLVVGEPAQVIMINRNWAVRDLEAIDQRGIAVGELQIEVDPASFFDVARQSPMIGNLAIRGENAFVVGQDNQGWNDLQYVPVNGGGDFASDVNYGIGVSKWNLVRYDKAEKAVIASVDGQDISLKF